MLKEIKIATPKMSQLQENANPVTYRNEDKHNIYQNMKDYKEKIIIIQILGRD